MLLRSATRSLFIPAMVPQQGFFLSCGILFLAAGLEHHCLPASAPAPRSPGFSQEAVSHMKLFLFVIILYRGAAWLYFFLFCAAKASLSAQASRCGPASMDQTASLLCRALSGPVDNPRQAGAEQASSGVCGQLEWEGVSTWTVWLYRKVSFWNVLQNTSGILLPRALGKEEQPAVFFGVLSAGFQQQSVYIWLWSAVALLSLACVMPTLQRITSAVSFCCMVTVIQLGPTTGSRTGPVPIPARLC